MLKLGILGSTRGSNLLPIVDAIHQGVLKAEIKIVLSNKADALILKRAKDLGLPCQYVDPSGLSRDAFDQKLNDYLKAAAVDVVILIGYMKILSKNFVESW